MRVNAQHKNARISAQKARLVADLIRGKDEEKLWDKRLTLQAFAWR